MGLLLEVYRVLSIERSIPGLLSIEGDLIGL